MDDFKLIYENFNKAIMAGDLDGAAAMRAEESRKSIEENAKTPEEKAGTLQMLQMMMPISYTANHLDQLEKKATLYMTATFKNPEDPQKTVNQELMIDFLKEGEVWKMNTVMYMPDPAALKKSADENFEPKENYDLDSDTSMGGRILDVKFEKDYTLVKIMMLDEEDLVFLPNKEELEKSGLKTAELLPYKILSVMGKKHKSNPMKIWGVSAELVDIEKI